MDTKCMERDQKWKCKQLLLMIVIVLSAAFLTFSWKAEAAVLGKDIQEGDVLQLESGDWSERYAVLDPVNTNIGTAGTFLLQDGFKDGAKEKTEFNETLMSNHWQGSTAQQWCTNYYRKLPDDISSKIIGVKTTDTESGSAWLVVNNIDGTKSDKDKVFFLSGNEYLAHTKAADHNANYNWLLRSAGMDCSEFEDYVGVACNGSIHNFSTEHRMAARPAFNLNLPEDICIKGQTVEDGTQVWTVDMNQLDHQQGTPEYTWTSDGTKCTATAKCRRCGNEVTEDGTVERQVIRETTDTEKGLVRCTATFKNKDFATQEKNFEVEKNNPEKDPDTPSQPEKPELKPGSEVAAGDYVYLGTQNPSGYQGMPLWRVLAKESDGTLLLMSEYLWSGNGNQGNEPLAFNLNRSDGNQWQSSKTRKWCQDFETAVLDGIDGLKIYETTKSDGFTDSPDNPTIQYNSVTNALNKDRVFFLSAEETLEYLPSKADRIAYTADGEKIGKADSWWLRSPRYQSNVCSGRVSSVGEMQKHFVDELSMARPAFRGNLDTMNFALAGKKNQHSVWTTENAKVPAEVLDKKAEPSKPGTNPDQEPTKPSEPAKPNEPENPEEPVKPTVKPAVNTVKVGRKYTVSGASYQVLSVKKATVSLVKAKNAKSISVPATVKISGKNYKVVQLNGKAFSAKKIRTVIVGKNVTKISKNTFAKSKATKVVLKTKKLKKSSVKGCFKTSKVKTVQVKVGTKKQNKKMVKTYKKAFTKKNCGKKVNVR